MYRGSFYGERGGLVEVSIHTKGQGVVEIGSDGGGVYFCRGGVDLHCDTDDEMDVLQAQSGTIHLLCRDFLADLYAQGEMDIPVVIRRNGRVVFCGYVIPQTYEQHYTDELEELEVNVTGIVGVLGKVGRKQLDIDWDAERVSFDALLQAVVAAATDRIAAAGCDVSVVYDGSREIPGKGDALEKGGVRPVLLRGKDDGDAWSGEEIARNVLQYLGLQLVQDGNILYVRSLCRGGQGGTVRTIDLETVSGTDTTLSVGETWNKYEVTCEVTHADEDVTDPLGDDYVKSRYTGGGMGGGELVRTDVVSVCKNGWQGGSDALAVALRKNDTIVYLSNLINALYSPDGVVDERSRVERWYMRLMESIRWDFHHGDTTWDWSGDMQAGRNMGTVLSGLCGRSYAFLVDVAKETKTGDRKDNSVVNTLDYKRYMCIPVNGNGKAGIDGVWRAPSWPIATFKGQEQGAVFSPDEAGITNYLVVSGTLMLAPRYAVLGDYGNYAAELLGTAQSTSETEISNRLDSMAERLIQGGGEAHSRGDGSLALSMPVMYNCMTPATMPQWMAAGAWIHCPYDDVAKQYQYNYSSPWTDTDTISQVPLLRCMLVIGDKCVVETDEAGSRFRWQPFKEQSACGSAAEYLAQSFTVGINPKIGDYIIGQEHEIENTIRFDMGIEAKGLAIPIRQADGVSGRVRFEILGLVPAVWKDTQITKKPSFWNHTQWGTDEVCLPVYTSAMWLSGFEIKAYSDGGYFDKEGKETDIVYMSDTDETYERVNDGITLGIHSGLSSREYRELGVKKGTKLSEALLMDGGQMNVIKYKDTGAEGLPEKVLVDALYSRGHVPSVRLRCGVLMRDDDHLDDRWRHNALGKTFRVGGRSERLGEDSVELVLNEE